MRRWAFHNASNCQADAAAVAHLIEEGVVVASGDGAHAVGVRRMARHVEAPYLRQASTPDRTSLAACQSMPTGRHMP